MRSVLRLVFVDDERPSDSKLQTNKSPGPLGRSADQADQVKGHVGGLQDDCNHPDTQVPGGPSLVMTEVVATHCHLPSSWFD